MERGRIITDEKYETSVPGIYAIGDVTGGIQLAPCSHCPGQKRSGAYGRRGYGDPHRISFRPVCIPIRKSGCVGISADEAKAREWKQ